MLSNILNKARESLDSTKKDVQRYKSRDFLDATMAASALICLADGTLGKEEKAKMIRFVSSQEALSVFDSSEVRERFSHWVDELEADPDIGEMGVFSAVGKMKGKDEQTRLILRLAIAIGGADGNFDPREQKQAARLARELGLSPGEFDLPEAGVSL